MSLLNRNFIPESLGDTYVYVIMWFEISKALVVREKKYKFIKNDPIRVISGLNEVLKVFYIDNFYNRDNICFISLRILFLFRLWFYLVHVNSVSEVKSTKNNKNDINLKINKTNNYALYSHLIFERFTQII